MHIYKSILGFIMFILNFIYRFSTDLVTYDVDKQFLWGSSLMINPVLEKVCLII